MTQRFTVVVEIDAENNTAQAFSEFNKGVDSAGKSSKLLDGVMNAVGQRLVGLAEQLPQIAAETFKMGVQSQAASLRFERFAGSTERAEELLQAFQTATGGTVDKMGAMTSAARLLQMGLVSNSDEMATVAEIATKLGDQTQGATDRISDFSLLLSNQSIPRLDNFGISSGKVRARIKELQEQTAGLSREQAFNQAVMEEGQKALAILGDSSELASVKMDKLSAAVKDAQTGLGEMLVGLVDGIGGVDEFAARIRGIPVALDQVILMVRAFGKASRENFLRPRQAMEDFSTNLRALVHERQVANIVFEEAAFIQSTLTERTTELTAEQERYFASVRKTEAGIVTLSAESFRAADAVRAHKQSQKDIEVAILSTISAMEEEKRAAEEANTVLEEQNRILGEAAVKQADLASSLVEATDAEIAATAIRELGTLLGKGTITVDDYRKAVTETQLAFGLADEASINLSNRLLTLVSDFGEGKVAAENFDDELERLIQLNEAENLQLEKFGELLTETVDPAKNLQMTTEDYAIALGDTSDASRDAAAWIEKQRVATDKATLSISNADIKLHEFSQRVGRLPTVKTVTIKVDVIGDTEFLPRGPLTQEGFQTGGVSGGGLALVGELEPEVVRLPPGSQVFNSNTTNQFTMNISGQTSSGVIQDFETMRSLVS